MADKQHVTDLYDTIDQVWIPAFQDMAQQLTDVMMEQMFAVGALLDAKTLIETQREFQLLSAEAHRDYQPDDMMCVFGTNVRSLAAAEQKARVNTRAIDLTLLKHDMMSQDMAGTVNSDTDIASRFKQFVEVFCDSAGISGTLDRPCDTSSASDQVNKDINYTDAVDSRYTLDVDFTDTTKTKDEDNVLALSRNLFSFENFHEVPQSLVEQSYAKDQMQDMRSIEAMRSVATDSFAHIVGMRSAGADDTDVVRPYMDAVMQQLGLDKASPDIDLMLGKNPSYYAQMEVLTHKLYEDPRFFSNLYTTPVNVERIGATLQAIRLMQDRDRYESSLRREMLASVILELSVRDRQDQIQNTTIGCTYNVIGGC